MKRKEQPSQKLLHEYFKYDALTGVLYWRVSLPNGVQAGTVAGRQKFGKNNRYVEVGLLKERWLVHRLIWKMVYGYDPDEIDHINCDELDNRLCNLREVTRSQNAQNMRVFRTHKQSSQWKGVIKATNQKTEAWRAVILRNVIGTFPTELEAHAAYIEKAKELFGEYANPGYRFD